MPSLICPFRGLRPAPGRAADVAAPPYDVLNTQEARAVAEGRPWSFLHISKPEIDLPAETDPHAPEVYAKGAENLARMIDEGVLRRDQTACYYVYRLRIGDHVQTGIVAAASVAAYDQGRIRKHEHTRPEKEDDRVRQISALNAQTGPVAMCFVHDANVAGIIGQVVSGPPELEVTGLGGVEHTLWVLSKKSLMAELTTAFDAMAALYITDGHHRSASASRVAAARRAAVGSPDGEAGFEWFLSVIFPDNEMQILDYNRVVSDLNGLDAAALLAKAAEKFEVTLSAGAAKPDAPRRFGMYLDGQWYSLVLNDELMPAGDPVASLDVNLIHGHLIEPLLGIADPRRDPRIDYVGGIRGLVELERRVDSGEMAVAFALYPTSMAALIAVADAGEVMPTKSTWFEPKLADGLVSHVLDRASRRAKFLEKSL